MIYETINGVPTALLHLEHLPQDEQETLLGALLYDMQGRPPEFWEKPYTGSGSMDPSFVGWPRIVIERGSTLLDSNLHLLPKYGLQTHLTIGLGGRNEENLLLLFTSPAEPKRGSWRALAAVSTIFFFELWMTMYGLQREIPDPKPLPWIRDGAPRLVQEGP